MKKFLSVILASVLVFSLAACSKNNTSSTQQTNTPAASTAKTDEFKPKEVTKFADILDNMVNKDKFFVDSSIIKVTIKSADYKAMVNTIVENAMKDKNVDLKNAKQYNYYKNVNLKKEHKVFVVAYDASKVPTALYEVNMTVGDKDVPTLVDVKKVDNAINDVFKTQFAKEVQ